MTCRHARALWPQPVIAIAFALHAVSVPGATADAYPNRPIRLIVPFSPGGVSDTVARIVAEKLEATFRQPVVIENKTGASGNIASELVAKAAPDGYTLLVGATSMTILPSTYGGRAVDPVRAFAPITKLVTQPILIATNPELRAESLADLLAIGRSAPGRLAYSTAGIGTTDHLSAALLWSRANVDALHVPYANSGQEIKDLLRGEIKVAFITLGAVRQLLLSGQLKALAVTGQARTAALPDVPTVAESGFPGFEVTSWYGVLAPAGTPVEIVDRLNLEIVRILRLPEVREKIVMLGAEPAGTTREQFADEIRSQLKLWPPIVKAAGIAIE